MLKNLQMDVVADVSVNQLHDIRVPQTVQLEYPPIL